MICWHGLANAQFSRSKQDGVSRGKQFWTKHYYLQCKQFQLIDSVRATWSQWLEKLPMPLSTKQWYWHLPKQEPQSKSGCALCSNAFFFIVKTHCRMQQIVYKNSKNVPAGSADHKPGPPPIWQRRIIGYITSTNLSYIGDWKYARGI